MPGIVFDGVGGPLMEQEGMISLYPMDRLSVMGLVEVVKHLPGLLSIRNGLKRHFLAHPPDLFIGVDAPISISVWKKASKRPVYPQCIMSAPPFGHGVPEESKNQGFHRSHVEYLSV